MGQVVNTSVPAAAKLELPQVLERYRGELTQLESLLRDDVDVEQHELTALLQWVFGNGGKRLRPGAVFAVARLGNPDPTRVQLLAAAVETLHAATLVHDDLVDRSVVRRGEPTLNTRWSAGAVVLAGDWLFARAAAFAARVQSVRVMTIFSRTLDTMTAGELQQLFGREGVPEREEYEFRIYAKTASLFEASTECAAHLTAEGDTQTNALANYGRELGMAFQIVDDILDFTGDERRLGKPVGSDLRSGTITLPVLRHLEAAPQSRRLLNGNGDGIEQLIDLVRNDEDALSGARREAAARVDAALLALEALPTGEAREGLADIARYAVERDF